MIPCKLFCLIGINVFKSEIDVKILYYDIILLQFFRSLKLSCKDHLKRDENGKVTDIENPSGLFVRNAEVGVIANSEDLRFSLR